MMKTNHSQHVSIADIAAACGVSAMTVSRALRQNSQVRPQTRETILAKAQELGYMRASRLGRPETSRVASTRKAQLIVGSFGRDPVIFHARLLTSIEQHLAELGYECVIRSSDGNYPVFMRMLEAARHTLTDATLILGNFRPEELNALVLALPGAALVDNPGTDIADCTYSSFAFDNTEAARLGVGHLLERGRKRILLVGGLPEHFFTREVEAGYRATLARYKIPVEESLIRYTDFTADSAAEAVERFLADGGSCDAIFTNDEMATGVYRVLMARHLTIPGDIAVCGCDNLPIGEQLYPPLTTVFLNYDDLAAAAVRHVMASSAGYVAVRTRLLPRLQVRQST